MKKLSSFSTIVLVAVLIVTALLVSIVWKNHAPSEYDEFAQCLTDNGAQVYEAYWCSACARQKDMFGSAYRHLDTTECSSPGSSTFDLCPDITSTPTWETADGERVTGVQSFEDLAELYGCELPE